jgi:hypothetical protein
VNCTTDGATDVFYAMFYSTTRRAVYCTTEGANVLTLSLSVLLMAPLPCELICVNQHSYVIFSVSIFLDTYVMALFYYVYVVSILELCCVQVVIMLIVRSF